MFNSGKPLLSDRAEVARITRAKISDDERKKRIFNPATRTIGIDKNALDLQVQEKKMLRDLEQAKNEAFTRQILQNCETFINSESKKIIKQKEKNLEIIEFRKRYQAPETRREYDLNDPLKCKKGQPNRIGDNDPRVTLSSAQRFDGEHGPTKEFKADQIQQQRVWLELQIYEKKMALEEEKNVEQSWNKAENTVIERAKALASLEDECNKKLIEANYRFNQSLATEQKMKRKIMETENEEDKMVEVYNSITGDFLTENVERAFNSTKGPGILTPSLYKGLTPTMKQAIYDHQARQREELKMRKEELEKQKKDWAEYLNMQARCDIFSDRQSEMKKRITKCELKNFNLLLADKQRNEQQFLNNVLYKPKVSDEFFDQFNKTAR